MGYSILTNLSEENSLESSSRIVAPDLKKIAVVLPRYGAELGGGAETLTRALILALQEDDRKKNYKRTIEVWTTCAKDHRTWDNYYTEGTTEEDGLIVRRFLVDKRDLDIFIRAELDMQAAKPLSIKQQFDWLGAGVNSQALYQHIAQFGRDFSALIFAPYLFATTFWGSMIYPEKSFLIPCLHNEAYAYLDVMRQMFFAVKGLIFNAYSEMELASELYGKEILKKGKVVGMGFVPVEKEVKMSNFSLDPKKYLLYSGRKEQGKNLDLLISFFVNNKKEYPELKLLLIGSGEINFLKELPDGVIDLGFVSSEEKQYLMKNALALCQPSVNESFSIVLMESWQLSTPVIVHSQCAVTKEHVINSGGGLYFANQKEFTAILKKLIENPDLVEKIGEQGRKYVAEVYSWDAVLNRLDDALRV